MMNHATFKASLFMAAGIVDHETGHARSEAPERLAQAMPITATVALVAAAAMAGVPLLNGFLSKEMFFAETMFAGEGAADAYRACPRPRRSPACSASRTRCASFTRCSSVRLAQDLPRAPHEPTRGMLLPSALLVLACLLVGILPARTLGPFLHTAVVRRSSGRRRPSYSLQVWHGFTVPLVMSVLALVGRRFRST